MSSRGAACGLRAVELITALRADDLDAVAVLLVATDTRHLRELVVFLARWCADDLARRLDDSESYDRVVRQLALAYATLDS